ncbi:MAG: rolling circle replication-associated protein [Desulfurella sp.]
MIQLKFEDLKEKDLKNRKKKIRLLTQELIKLVRSGKYRALAVTLTFKDFEMYLDFHKKGGIKWLLNDLNTFIKREYKRRDWFYLWVMEIQRRGVPHFHILMIIPIGVRIPFLDRWVFTFGMTNIKELKKFGSRYLLKYLEKDNYQQDYDHLRMKLKDLGVRVRTYGYSLRLLYEGLRFLMNRTSYVKWFLSRVQGLDIEAVYDVIKGGLIFYYYKIKDSQVKDLFSYAYESFNHIKKLFLSFFDFQFLTSF